MGKALAVIVAALGLLASCGGANEGISDRDRAGTTWATVIKPLVGARCASCHMRGGPGGIEFTDENIQELAPLLVAKVEDGTMPPWLPGSLGVPLLGERSLSPIERAALRAWAEAGFPLGQRPVRDDSVAPESPYRGEPDATITIDAADLPSADESYRCYPVSIPPAIWGRVATALRWRVPSASHHTAGIVVDAAGLAASRARLWKDGRPGFSCTNDLGGQPVNTLPFVGIGLEAFVPMPDGAGLPLPPGGGLVFQIHSVPGQQTLPLGVDLWLAPLGASPRPLVELDFVAPVEVPCPSGVANGPADPCSRDAALARSALVPPAQLRTDSDQRLQACGHTLAELLGSLPYALNNPDHFLVNTDCTQTLATAGRIVMIHPHLHTRGFRATVELSRAGAPWQILVDIPRWRWRWETAFLLRQPIAVTPGDKVRIRCTFDNGALAQWGLDGSIPGDEPVPGPRQLARYRVGGLERDQEMCAAFLTLVRDDE